MNNYEATEQAYKNGYKQGYADATKWIPVTERLPEKTRMVLVADNREYYVDLWRFIGNGWIGEDGHYFAIEEVTHWMPLPKPPVLNNK